MVNRLRLTGLMLALVIIVIAIAMMSQAPTPTPTQSPLKTTPQTENAGSPSPRQVETQTNPGTTPESQQPETGLGGITGGLVVRGAELVQPWISIEYKPTRGGDGYGAAMTIKLDKVFPLAPTFKGDANSFSMQSDKGPWSPLGFYDSVRGVIYVLEYPVFYARSLLEGRIEELDRMFQALVIPGDLKLDEARLLPPGAWGVENAPGIIALTEDGDLVVLPPPTNSDDVVPSGKSGITRVVFLGEPIDLVENVEGFALAWHPNNSGDMALIYWRENLIGTIVFEVPGLAESLQGGTNASPRWSMEVELPVAVKWTGGTISDTGEVILIASGSEASFEVVLSPSGSKYEELKELGAITSGTLVNDEWLLVSEGGVYLYSTRSGSLKQLEPEDASEHVYSLVSNSNGLIVALHEKGAGFYRLSDTRLVPVASLGLSVEVIKKTNWLAGGIMETEGIAERLRLIHGVDVENGDSLFGLVLVGSDTVLITAFVS